MFITCDILFASEDAGERRRLAAMSVTIQSLPRYVIIIIVMIINILIILVVYVRLCLV